MELKPATLIKMVLTDGTAEWIDLNTAVDDYVHYHDEKKDSAINFENFINGNR